MELCVLDTRAGAELEHASLSTLGIARSPILPPPPSSQPSSATSATTAIMAAGTGDHREETKDDEITTTVSSLVVPPPPPPPLPPSSEKTPQLPLGTYHNAFRACEGRLFLLGSQELRAVRVQQWSQRVDSLVAAGEWLEALAVALDHYEQKILPAEKAAAALAAMTDSGGSSATGGISGGGDLAGQGSAAAAAAAGGRAGRSGGELGGFPLGGVGSGGGAGSGRGNDGDPWGSVGVVAGFDGRLGERGTGAGVRVRVSSGDHYSHHQQQQQRRPAPRSEAAEQITDLLAQYLRLAINNAPAADVVSSSSGAGGGGGVGASRINLARSHFQMLAGVCTEFCVVTGRLDMLFGQVFQAFRARGQQG